LEKEVVIKSKSGLHARPAAQFATFAKKYPEKVMVFKGDNGSPATSLLSVLGLGISHGDTIRLQVEGDNAEQILSELAEFLENLAYGV
jgi:phosphocarrier protein HPr